MSEFNVSQIIEALSEPFYSGYVEWKPQQVSKDGTKALAAAYVDARRYQERLDQVCPDWSSKIELLADGRVAKVSLTIAGVTREDVGEADPSDPNTVTTAVAQAFKRACAAFGLGRYLYFLPLAWVGYDSQHKRLLETPSLPDWALPSSERLEKDTAAAIEREAEEVSPEPALSDPGATTVHFGKNKGKTIAQIWAMGEEGQGWVRWVANKFDPRGDHHSVHLQRMAKAFLLAQTAYAG